MRRGISRRHVRLALGLACVGAVVGEYGVTDVEMETEMAEVRPKGDVLIQTRLKERPAEHQASVAELVVEEDEHQQQRRSALSLQEHAERHRSAAAARAAAAGAAPAQESASRFVTDGEATTEGANASDASGAALLADDLCAPGSFAWKAQACERKFWFWNECYTCGDRIMWLRTNKHMTDKQAKSDVALQFPTECGDCDQRTCKEVAGEQACGSGGCWTCGQRIGYLTSKKGMDELEAGKQVAKEFPVKCGPCARETAPPETPAPTTAAPTTAAPTPEPTTPEPTSKTTTPEPPTPPEETPAPKPTHRPHAPAPAPAPDAPTSAPKPVTDGDYKLMSYNVLFNNKKFWDVAGVIANVVAPDIVNLQEAIKDHPGEIVKRLNHIGPGTWQMANNFSRSAYWCGLTAYRSDKWDMLWHAEQGMRQSGDTRGLCGALLKRKVDGQKLCVFGAHPVWRSGGTDHWAKDIIRRGADLFQECAAHGAPSSFLCDCNTMDHESVRKQLAETTGWKWKTAVADGYDQIFLQEDPDPRAASTTHGEGAVHPHAGRRGCKQACSQKKWGYSDHPPVYVEVSPH